MFVKIKYIALSFIFAVNILSAQTSFLFDLNTDEYSKIKGKYLYLNSNNEVENIQKNEIVLREAQSIINNFQWNLPVSNLQKEISIIFSVSISNTMSGLASIYADTAMKIWAKNIDFTKTEVAVTAFNYYNFLLQDFTKNKSDIANSLDNVQLFGGVDYNAAFLNEPSSALKLAKSAKNRPVIILFCDGSGQANVKDISEKALALNAVIYCIAFTDGATKSLKDLVHATGGAVFDNVNLDTEIEKICKLILALETYSKATEFSYNSNSCSSRKSISIEEKLNNSFSSDSTYVEDNKFSSLEYLPDNSMYFGELPLGAQSFDFIGIKALIDTVIVNKVYSSNKNFIPDDVFPFTIPRDSVYNLKINYKSAGKDFDVSTFSVLSDACRNPSFYGSAGSYDVLNNKQTLVLLAPNGNEKFLSGNDTTIVWTGVPPDMTIRLEFSTNAGMSWNEISPNATGLKYKWKNIPKMPSDDCLMKVTQLTKNISEDNIIRIDAAQKAVFDLEWIPNRNNIISAGSGGDIAVWDAQNGTRTNLCFSGIDRLSSLAIIDDSLAAYAAMNENIYVFNIDSTNKIEYTLSSFGSLITCLSDGIAGHFLLSGDYAGNVSLWDVYTQTRKYVFSAHNAPITNIVFTPDGRRFATSAGNEVKLWHTSNGFSSIILPKFDFAVNSISISGDGTQLVASTGDGKLVSWDIVQNKLAWTKPIFESPVYEAVFAPDSNLLAFAPNDRSIRLKNTDEDRDIFTYKFHTANVDDIKWDISTGRYRIASADNKGFIHIWFLDDIPFYNISLQSDQSNDYWSIYERQANLLSVDFNASPINVARDTTVWAGIVNNTPLTIKIDSVLISGKDKTAFNVFFPSSVNLKSNHSLSLSYEFKPQSEKVYIANIDVFSGYTRFSSKISGEGVKLVADATPKILDFGKIIVNGFFEDHTIITNYSGFDIQVDSVIITDKNNVFDYKGKQKFVLNSGISDNLVFEFLPKNIQRYSGTVRIYNSGNYSPIIVQLWGEGIESIIVNDSTLEFDDYLCQTQPIIDSLKIVNMDNEDIKLISAEISKFDKSSFGLIDLITPYINIASKDSIYLHFWFLPSKVGNNLSELELIFDYKNNYTSKFVRLKGKKDLFQIVLKPNTINFNTLANQTKNDKFRILNTGTLPIKLGLPADLGLFNLDCLDCDSLHANDSVDVNVMFKGYSKDTNIVNIHPFTDDCNKTANLLLVATVGVEDSKVAFPGLLPFGTTKCQSAEVTKNIDITNVGTSNLVIEEIILGDMINFSLESSLGFIVKPGDKHRFSARFEPKSAGGFSTDLTFKSNAINVSDGTFKIKLTGSSIINIWDISQNSIIFDGVLANKHAERNFSISNPNNDDIKIYFSNLNNYIIQSAQPLIIPAFGSSNVKVEFLGGSTGLNYAETLLVSDSCGLTKELKLTAEIRDYAEVAFTLPIVKGSPGDTLLVPLKLYSPENIELPQVSGYNTIISFNASLLYNFDDSIKDSVNGNTRYIVLNNLPSIPPSDSIVYRLKLIALLTDTNKTELVIEKVKAIDRDVTVQLINGEFDLINVCGDGISNSGILFLSQNEPNPANAETKIKYHLIEKGLYSIELYDYSGKLISILENGKKKSGDYELIINLQKYSNGAYYYVLRTETKVVIKKMIIIR